MKNLLKENKELLKESKNILIAVSTGLDSMFLLEFLLENQKKLELDSISVAHYNHKQREQSEEEEQFIKEYCQNKNIPIYVDSWSSFDLPFSETTAREARYKFFFEVIEKQNLDTLITAHHKDDQSETVFMRLVRGSLPFALTSIKRKTKKNNVNIVRPLLSISKKEIEESYNGIYYQDNTNFENDYLRNRIRNIYIPSLEKENKNFSDNLYNLADDLTSLEMMMNELLDKVNIHNTKEFFSYSINTQAFLFDKLIQESPFISSLPRKRRTHLLRVLNQKETHEEMLNKDCYISKTKEYLEIKPYTKTKKRPKFLNEK